MKIFRFFVMAALAICVCPPVVSAGADPTISATSAREMQAKGQLMIIDVRTPHEWKETGIPAGAKTIEFSPAVDSAVFLSEVLRVASGDRNVPIAVICRSGHRSTMAQDILAQHGFTNVLNIQEGVLGGSHGQGWVPRGLPVETLRQ